MRQVVFTIDLDAVCPETQPPLTVPEMLPVVLRTKLGCRAHATIPNAGFLATQRDGQVVSLVGSWRYVDTDEPGDTRGTLTSARDALLEVCQAAVSEDITRRAVALTAGADFISKLAEAHATVERLLGAESPPKTKVICEYCKKLDSEENHPKGMIFVGWGIGWDKCPRCGGSGEVET